MFYARECVMVFRKRSHLQPVQSLIALVPIVPTSPVGYAKKACAPGLLRDTGLMLHPISGRFGVTGRRVHRP